MRPLLVILLGSSFILTSTLQAQTATPSFMLNNEEALQIAVNNRILATVNGKAITVMDVMKKMDMVFYRQYPQYVSSKSARYQFYMMSWKQVLQDLIDKELLLADAEESKLAVSNGDVRQEMETVFGPNIIINLDQAGLTMDEAWKMVKEEITIRRMLMFKVNLKAMKKVNPQDIRAAYEKQVKAHTKAATWTYRVITVRNADLKVSEATADKIYALLNEGKSTLDELSVKLKEDPSIDPETKVNISEELQHKESEIAPAYKEILTTLPLNSYSQPRSQKSRDNSVVYRIFYLKDKNDGAPPSLSSVAAQIKDKLIQEAVDEETAIYLTKLRKQFGLDEEVMKTMIPESFEPFALQETK